MRRKRKQWTHDPSSHPSNKGKQRRVAGGAWTQSKSGGKKGGGKTDLPKPATLPPPRRQDMERVDA